MTPPQPKFLTDSMLGKLARYLVLMGYDATYAGVDGRADRELLDEALREGRIFLTRDTKIPPVKGVIQVVIRPERAEEQLAQVLSDLSLAVDRGRFFSRCTYCNQSLERLEREKALPFVPPKVRELETEFFRCPQCARVYWNGTHTDRILKKLEKFL